MTPPQIAGVVVAAVILVPLLVLWCWQAWAALRGDEAAAERPWGPPAARWDPYAASRPSPGRTTGGPLLLTDGPLLLSDGLAADERMLVRVLERRERRRR